MNPKLSRDAAYALNTRPVEESEHRSIVLAVESANSVSELPDWVREYLYPTALKFVSGEFIPAVNTEQQDTIDGNARKVD